MNTIVIAIISTGVIGLSAALLLTVASKLMYVKADPKIGRLREALPGANCGACGYTGCDGYAEALAKGEAKPDSCPPGGAEVYKQISAILGTDTGDGPEKKTAVVRCAGDSEAKNDKMVYTGIKTCLAAEQMYGGPNACTFGCLGFGDCAVVCPADAICLTGGIARVDARKCTGCGLCAAACPRNVIEIMPESVRVAVLCRNTEKGAVVRKKCAKGCIACTKCVRECPVKAVTMSDNLAVIDYGKCDGCGHCTEVCITNVLQARR